MNDAKMKKNRTSTEQNKVKVIAYNTNKDANTRQLSGLKDEVAMLRGIFDVMKKWPQVSNLCSIFTV